MTEIYEHQDNGVPSQSTLVGIHSIALKLVKWDELKVGKANAGTGSSRMPYCLVYDRNGKYDPERSAQLSPGWRPEELQAKAERTQKEKSLEQRLPG